jgi:hypothetical protein
VAAVQAATPELTLLIAAVTAAAVAIATKKIHFIL